MDALLNQAVTTINGFLWDYIIIALLIGAGFWFTCTTKFTQITQIPEMIRLLKAGVGKKTTGNEISSFQAFCISVASHVGVGNIAGIAIAVVLGGPGAVFWMWFIAVLGAATSFVECTLAQIYKEPLPGGGFHGGPAYYIRHGLKSPALAVGFAVLISVTYGLIYNSVQANTIAASLSTFGVSQDFRIQWDIIDVISSKEMRELFSRHTYGAADDLDEAGQITNLLKEAAENYKLLARDENVQNMTKIKYRKNLRKAIYTLADAYVME